MGHSRVDWAGSARRLERAAHRGERAQASHRGGVHVVGRLPSLACGLLELCRLGEAARLESLRLLHVHGLERGLLAVVLALAQRAQLEVVARVEARAHGDVVLDELEELLLEMVDLLQREHRAEHAEVDVVQRAVVPHLLCEDECGEQDGPPRRAEDGDARDGDEALDVDERDDEALRGEARARVDRVQRVEDRLLGGHLALGPLGRVPVALHRLVGGPLARVEVERVVLLGEEGEEVGRARAHLLALHDAVVDDDGDAEDDLVDVGPGDRRVDEDRGGRVEPLLRLRRRGSLHVHWLRAAATARRGLLRHRAGHREDGAAAGAGDVQLLRGLHQALAVPDHRDASLLQPFVR
mmetsp:Transcript_7748/g.18177  ORF Transcript_7748/g.18177 Transcript_7748/m.18177 type:complete len:353 (-) Transcript_7748:176-1234(-)